MSQNAFMRHINALFVVYVIILSRTGITCHQNEPRATDSFENEANQGQPFAGRQDDHITGFVTVSSGEMVAEKLTKVLRRHLPAYPLPILRLVRLAVDERFQGHGIGRLLLRAMLELALEMRNRIGCIGVIVDAKPDAVPFYLSLGFKPVDLVSGALSDRPEPIAMFLPIGQIALATKEATD
jgi:GNAT superfamily N-acetyltransferase